MDVTEQDDLQFSSAEEADLVTYRAITPVAIIALLLGLASAFALVNLLTLLVAALAVLLAVFALRQIAASGGTLAGTWLAVLGLVLAIGFSSAAVSRTATRWWTIREQAKQISDQFIAFIEQGKLGDAHQLHLELRDRLPSGEIAQAYYEVNASAQEELKLFFEKGAAKLLLTDGPKAKIRFDKVLGQGAYENREMVDLLYQMELPGRKSAFPIVVRAERVSDAKTGLGLWHISGISEPRLLTDDV